MATRACYIALEGSEGCGKSTQAAWLAADLGAALTREQGGTPIGQLIRSIVLDPDHTELDHRAEALLNAADRAQHLAEVVEPHLAAGRHVVSDRSVYSTLAYQGYGRQLPLDDIRRINDWAIRGRWPDLAILIDVEPATLAARLAVRTLDRFEQESAGFHERVRAGFAEMAAIEPERWVVVDGNHSPEAVRASDPRRGRGSAAAVNAVVPLWDNVIGQPDAVEQLRRSTVEPVHAYLFLGPAGSGKRRAARTFAAALLCRNGQCGVCRDCTLALHGEHPDLVEVERVGPAITVEQAGTIVRQAVLAPVEGPRKVMLLDEFHLLQPAAASKLLKTIEEPPASTVFCVLADQLVPDLVTIASRCVKVPFRAIPDDIVITTLVGEGVEPATAAEAARAAAGDLSRARLLATDPKLSERRTAFASVPARLDGTGTRVAAVTDELLGLIDAAAEPLKVRQAAELAELAERVAQLGERGAGRNKMEDRHKRELRRHRTDELRSGLGTIAGVYRDRLADGVTGRRAADDVAAVTRIHDALEALERNPNEPLLLQSLLLALPAVARS